MKANAKLILPALTVSCLLAAASSRATSFYDVPATANIFASGLSNTVAPAGGGGGTLPILVTLSPGQGNALQFSATGTIGQFYYNYLFGPDGWDGTSPNINSYGGIS